MTTQAIFYRNVVPLSAKQHAAAHVEAGTDYGFAREANAVPITAVEFPNASREYPIVFTGRDDAVMPIVLLSVQQRGNRYVDAQGRWTARYIPAFVRRYPFVVSSSDEGVTFTLCVDESYPGFNTEGRGERLFDAAGERTQYLNAVLNFQQEYQSHFRATQELCRNLRELGLLEPAEARFTSARGKSHTFAGVFVVNRDKLRALDDARLAAMLRSGELELIHLHLHSLHHIATMGDFLSDDATAAATVP